MHIEKRKSGRKIKYFLAYSYREGGKGHKLRKYLGLNLKPALLEERKAIAEKLILKEIYKYKLIRDPLQVKLPKEEIELIKRLEIQIPLKISHLSERDWIEFSKLFTFNTNAIEGSKLNLAEVRDILEKDKWPDKSKEDIAEAYGVDEAIKFIRQAKDHLSIELIKQVHKTVFQNSKGFAGKMRKKGEDVVVMDNFGRIVHEGASPVRILPLLKKLAGWYDQNKNKYPPLILGAVVHNQFENIHPFADGNGRVGRILLNNILIKHKLPPINISFKNRAEYYASLQAYEKSHNLKPTINLFLKEYAILKRKLGKS